MIFISYIFFLSFFMFFRIYIIFFYGVEKGEKQKEYFYKKIRGSSYFHFIHYHIK